MSISRIAKTVSVSFFCLLLPIVISSILLQQKIHHQHEDLNLLLEQITPLNNELADAASAQQQSIRELTRDTLRLLLVSIVGFALAGSAIFFILRNRVARGMLNLSREIERLRLTGGQALAPANGGDELEELGQNLNKMADQWCSERRRLLNAVAKYERAQSVANIGSWEVDFKSGTLEWSPETFKLFGLNPEEFAATEEAFFATIHPEDREWFLRRREEWLNEPETEFDEEHRIVRPDGSVRWVREMAHWHVDDNGDAQYSTGTVQDITELRQHQEEARQLSLRLSQVMERIAEGMIVLDSDLRLEFCNHRAAVLLGQSRDAIQADPARALAQGLPDSPVLDFITRARQTAQTVTEQVFQPANELWLELRIYTTPEEVTLFISDITTTHDATRALRYSLNLQKTLINALPAHLALLDADGYIRDINQQWRHFGQSNAYPGEDFGLNANYLEVCDNALPGDCAGEAATVATGLRQVLAGQTDSFTLEYPCHSPEIQRWFRLMATPIEGGPELGGRGAVVMHIDVTQRKLAELELESLAYYDPMTGLFNRAGFERALDSSLQENWSPGAIMVLLDIVGQQDINNAFGYAAGDQVIIAIGQRLVELDSGHGTVCRLGGDQFALLVNLQNFDSLLHAQRAIARLFDVPVDHDNHSITVKAHCGFTTLGQSRRSVEELLAEAELAMSQSMAEEVIDGISWSRYSTRFEARLRLREDLVRELRVATNNGAFELHFQPKVDLSDGSMIAAEALLRWPHPVLGLQSPGLFIPLAEQTQLIGPIGNWVINEACRSLRQWQDQKLGIVRIAVNVSLHQFVLGDLVEVVERALDRYQLAPAALSLEVTESVFEEESEDLHRQLQGLHELGVRLSLDDFGTGYSSLLYLQRYRFDEIKIDQTFTRRMLTDPYSRSVVEMVINLAAVLGADIVAEGIEAVDESRLLQSLGCRVGQGFYYSMPLEAEDFRWLLQQRVPLPLKS